MKKGTEMDNNNRPRRREKNVTGSANGLYKRGNGLGTGPTGESGLGKTGQTGAGTQRSSGAQGDPGVQRSSGVQGGPGIPGGQGMPGGPGSSHQDAGTDSDPQRSGLLSGLGNLSGGTQNIGSQNTGTSTGTTRSSGKGKFLLLLIVVVVIAVILIMCISSRAKNSSSSVSSNYGNTYSGGSSSSSGSSSSGSSYSGSSYYGGGFSDSDYSDYFSSLFGGNSSYSSGWSDTTASSATLNTSVASGARAKRTQILGGGQDEVTIMVYMCGADLESQSGMASSDLKEMTNADIADNVNLIVYTGGASKWQNSVVSSSYNQIYQVQSGGVVCLNDNVGRVSMTDPSTLSSFISWCASNYPANRYELIFWDHGAGSVSGFGYDEKFPNNGSMSLAGISKALKNGGVTFDFIGFDACLMATMENALMLDTYADYLIASEETEPGYGWYYTDWLTELSSNTSMATIEIGKNIVDDFVTTSARQAQGQKATLSVVDLAELSSTTPEVFSEFSKSINDFLDGNEFRLVSNARNQTREFGSSSSLDMVDLANLAENLGNDSGNELASLVKSAVKYNRTSSGITNAYGLSIYFPYKSTKYVDRVISTYNEIGMDSEYTKCIRSFASLEVCGQASSGGTSSPFGSLFGDSYGSYSSYDSYSSYSSSSDMISDLLGSFLSGNYRSVKDLEGNSEFLDTFIAEKSITDEQLIQSIQDNSLDAAKLVFEEFSDGSYRMELSADDWAMIHSIDMNMFYDDGEGYINLGLDNIYDVDDEGRLIASDEDTWLAINGQVVSYFRMTTVDDGENYVIMGRVPVFLNGDTRADLIIVFDNDNPYGYIAGAYYVYDMDDPVSPKNITELNVGDTIDFICDYYDYDGNYVESYYLGEQMTISEEMTISDVELDTDSLRTLYKFTDIYNQEYWVEPSAE